MVAIPALWLPILLAAVLVFFVSFLLHMVLPFHRKDYKRLPNENSAMDALRQVPPGQYIFPCPSDPKEMKSADMQAAYKRGPVGMLIIRPSGGPNMGSALVAWFLFTIVIGVFVAYLTGRALSPGADYLSVFRFAGTTAFLAYASTHATDPIWKGESWVTASRHIFDGLVYGLVTGGAFGWLWP